ncbi:glycosyltransferase family 4 protein [Methylomonas koyamae]|uniref:glycosyltransferase family 4 protein n=1 Tax=Methylomonas koyamae TaxID=702114 RepID=UPI001128EB1A|nr:glycosyltransferase family 4 protein [Methylomonas koyamae]TPQ25505.1 hypothetical protein C2U68_15480 [Methylomonas koyamae]
MKIMIVSDWYSENMGYAENFLPKAFGKLGHEVHLVTSDLQVYATSPHYNELYRSKLGDARVGVGVFKKNDFTLHRNKSFFSRFGIEISGLEDKVREVKPDLVYCFEILQRTTLLLAKLKIKYRYLLFCESRLHSSIFKPPISLFFQVKFWINIKLMGLSVIIDNVDKFFPIANDVFYNITKYYKIPRGMCEISSLAVETDLFNSIFDDFKVNQLRRNLGFCEGDIVCVYTGRFTEEKAPLILALAIQYLQERGYQRFKGLFVGRGSLEYSSEISRCTGCVVTPFVSPEFLPTVYHASDIGVWPLQESNSQLDAMACGLPIIVNDSAWDREKFAGCGLKFKKGDVKDLAEKILSLSVKELRISMGCVGSSKVIKHYSWDALAKKKLNSFSSLASY